MPDRIHHGQTQVLPSWPFNVARGGVSLEALALLVGETNGMASDFTVASGLGAVAVKHTATPSNKRNNVAADAWWANAGTSPKLVAGLDGLLKWSPHNMILQSQTFDNASWTKASVTISANAATAPDGTLTADKLEEASEAGVLHYVLQNVVSIIGATYTVSVRAKAAERNWLLMSIYDGGANHFSTFDLANGVVGTVNDAENTRTITALGNGWYLCTVTHLATSTTHMSLIAASNGDSSATYAGVAGNGIYLWGAQTNRGTVPTEYLATTTAARYGLAIDYKDSAYGLLMEPAATNVVLNSQAFDATGAGWVSISNATVTPNAIAAPDGETTADLLTATGVDAFLQQNVTLAAGVVTGSIYVKAGTANFFRLSIYDWVSHHETWFNLSGAGSVGTNAVGNTSTITSLANGWYRVTVSRIAANNDPFLSFYFCAADSPITANGDSGYLWGAQVEAGSVATSPIPTFAATVTRAADVISKVVSAFPFSASAGTYYLDYTPDGSTFQYIAVFQDAGSSSFNMYYVNTGPNPIFAPGADVALDLGTSAANTRAQMSGAYATNDCAGSLDGAAALTDTSATPATGITLLYLGRYAGLMYGVTRIRRLVYVPRRVANGDLPTWRYTA